MIVDGHYYYIEHGSLAHTSDLMDLFPPRVFCYITRDSFHFGRRHLEHVAIFLKECEREDHLLLEELNRIEELLSKYAE